MFHYDKHALLYLYDTCNLNCGYCPLATGGYVNDNSQLNLYKDKNHIDTVALFFKNHNQYNWRITISGGEPTMMPNFNYFIDSLNASNTKISMYTNLTLHHESSAFKYILTNASKFYAIFATLHNEYYDKEEYFFEKVKLLKEAGVPIIVKIILSPKSLYLLEVFNKKCKELNVGFLPMSVLTENYPKKYTRLERNHIKNYISTPKQLIHLFGGLNVEKLKCNAGNKIINIDLRSGDIFPCIDLYPPYKPMGNIKDKDFKFFTKPTTCLKEENMCMCDMHYENEIIEGIAEDIEPLLHGYVSPIPEEQIDKIVENYSLKIQQSKHISMSKDNIDNYAQESKAIKDLKKIAKERLELIELLHKENEKKEEQILKFQNKSISWVKKYFK